MPPALLELGAAAVVGGLVEVDAVAAFTGRTRSLVIRNTDIETDSAANPQNKTRFLCLRMIFSPLSLLLQIHRLECYSVSPGWARIHCFLPLCLNRK